MNKKLDTKVGHEAENMRSQTHLIKCKKTHVYYYRRRVPTELVGIYPVKTIKFSLHTKDKKKAMELVTERDAFYKADFANYKKPHLQQSAFEPFAPHAVKTISLDDEQIDSLAKRYLRTNLSYDEEFRDQFREDSKEISEHFIQSTQSPELKEALAHFKNIEIYYDFFGQIVQDNYGVNFNALDKKSKDNLTRALISAYQKSGEITAKRNQGQLIKTDDIVSDLDTRITPKFTLDELYDLWFKDEVGRKGKTPYTYMNTLREFKQLVKDKPVSLITDKDAVLFRNKMRSDTLAQKTIENKMAHLQAMYSVALKNRVLRGENPFKIDLKPTTESFHEDRVAYSVEDLNVIFVKNPIYVESYRPAGGGGEASAWIPLLALLTGARLEELAQLRKSNVKNEEGIYYIHITNRDENRKIVGSVKNKSSIREVPLHKSIIEAGFIEYVENIKTDLIFNDITPDRFGARSGNFSKWYSRYLRNTLLIKDKTKTFHSFRHTFRNLLVEANIALEYQERLLGHSNPSMTNKYGSKYKARNLNQYVQQIQLPFKLPSITE